jgi:uncharacterized protein with ACT and thioredoxin-like domain
MGPTKKFMQSSLKSTNLDLQYDGVVVHGKNKGVATRGQNITYSSLLIQTKCPYGVAYEDIKKVTDLLKLKRELHHCCKSKIKGLKLDLRVAQNKALGMKINMEDRRKAKRLKQI